MLERVNALPGYVLQADELTYVDNNAILLVYVQYIIYFVYN